MPNSAAFHEPCRSLIEPSALSAAEKAGFSVYQERHTVSRPDDLAALAALNVFLRVDPSELIVTEAPVLDEHQRVEAGGVLIADQVFETSDWPARYLGRDFPGPDGEPIRFESEALAVTGIQFGWAIEQVARIAAVAGESAQRPAAIEVVLGSPSAVSLKEHLFIGLELQR